MVDSSDRERCEEARQELEQVIQQACGADQRVPVLVLANKQDVPGASSALVLESMLALPALREHCAALSIHPTVATTGEGVADGMQWLLDTISSRLRDSPPGASSSSSSSSSTSSSQSSQS